MHLLRWMLLLPVALAVLGGLLTAGIAAHDLVEQHMCPAASFERGICQSAGMGWVLRGIRFGSVALAVLATGAVAMALAPARQGLVLWATLAACLALALAYALASAAAWSTVAAALVGAAACAAWQQRRLAGHRVVPAVPRSGR